jgi:formyltetrahydrofolate deformylase
MTYSTKKPNTYALRVTCPAAIGIVAAVTSHLAGRGYYISELAQYDDEDTRRFFMRCTFQVGADQDPAADSTAILGSFFAAVADRFGMDWSLNRTDRPKRVLLLVSKLDHCLRELLAQWESGELNMDIVAIVSNHPDLEPAASRHGIAFRHLPVTKETKEAQELELRRLIDEARIELVVLARYMQILSDALSRDLAGRCINIHHSFLPSFKGGSPYAQAHSRGVKLIGATAHYVTGDLDEGPIIDQEVRRIDHRHSITEMQAMGREVERQVLLRAVRMHLEDRIFIDGNKTVVFS